MICSMTSRIEQYCLPTVGCRYKEVFLRGLFLFLLFTPISSKKYIFASYYICDKVEHKELVKKLQQRLDFRREDVEAMLDSFCDTVVERCGQMDTIMLQGLGTFEARKKMERVSVNPATGKRMLIPPKLVLVFKPNSAIKSQLKSKK